MATKATKNYYQLNFCPSGNYGHASLFLYMVDANGEMRQYTDRVAAVTYQSNMLDDDGHQINGYRANEETHPFSPISAPRTRNSYWYAEKFEIQGYQLVKHGAALQRLIERCEKVITEFNYRYKYPNDALAQFLAALQRLGWHEWVVKDDDAYDGGKHHQYDLK